MDANLVARLEAAVSKLEALGKGAPPAPPSKSSSVAGNAPAPGESPASKAWSDLTAGPLAKFLELSGKVGGVVKEQADVVAQAFAAVGSVISTASISKRPDAASLPAVLKPLSELIEKVVSIKEANRPSPLALHLNAVTDGIPSLGWVSLDSAPAPHVTAMREAAEFNTFKIIKENKDKDALQVDWGRAWLGVLNEMQGYVKEWHTTGLAWNAKGGDAKAVAAAPAPTPASAPPAPSAGGPPPPPPPPADYLDDKPSSAPAEGGTGALFSALNQGASVTAGLKHVDRSQMTHKNPSLRAGGTVPDIEPKAGSRKATPVAATAKPPRKELDGNKWVVENFTGDKEITLDGVEAKQIVYLYNLVDCVVQVKGKVNAVAVDNCRKTGILLESVVASVEIVNSKSLQIQVTGKAPTVSADKTDGLHLFLSKDSLDTELLTSKCSETNVSWPNGEDWEEKAVPEQFITTIKEGKVRTEIVQHKA